MPSGKPGSHHQVNNAQLVGWNPGQVCSIFCLRTQRLPALAGACWLYGRIPCLRTGLQEISRAHSLLHLPVKTSQFSTWTGTIGTAKQDQWFGLVQLWWWSHLQGFLQLKDIPKMSFPTVLNSCTFTSSLATTPVTMFLRDGSGENGVQMLCFSLIFSRSEWSLFILASEDSRCCSLVV